MKRTPLTRRAELKRKAPLKKVSTKQAKLNRDTRGIRRDPIEKFAIECDCGCGRPADDPHELVAGHGYRDKCMRDPRLILYLARACHDRIQGQPYAKQIAMVTRAMARRTNAVRGCRVVTIEKVAMYLTQE